MPGWGSALSTHAWMRLSTHGQLKLAAIYCIVFEFVCRGRRYALQSGKPSIINCYFVINLLLLPLLLLFIPGVLPGPRLWAATRVTMLPSRCENSARLCPAHPTRAWLTSVLLRSHCSPWIRDTPAQYTLTNSTGHSVWNCWHFQLDIFQLHQLVAVFQWSPSFGLCTLICFAAVQPSILSSQFFSSSPCFTTCPAVVEGMLPPWN